MKCGCLIRLKGYNPFDIIPRGVDQACRRSIRKILPILLRDASSNIPYLCIIFAFEDLLHKGISLLGTNLVSFSPLVYSSPRPFFFGLSFIFFPCFFLLFLFCFLLLQEKKRRYTQLNLPTNINEITTLVINLSYGKLVICERFAFLITRNPRALLPRFTF